MTSDGTEDGTERSVAAALAAWAADPRLAAATREGGCYLVLSGDARRVLYASESAKPLAAAVAGEDGGIAESLGLAAQIARSGLRETAPSLLRLRFDSRRIAPPAACLVARGALGDGSPALLLAFDKPVPSRMRRPAPETGGAAVEGPPPAAPAPEPVPDLVPGSRFVWRSDAQGRFGDGAGHPSGALRAAFGGEGWASLAASGRLLDGAVLLAALDAGRTFRAVPVGLALAAPERRLNLDVSGAPLARPGRAFEGFSGFGTIRAQLPIETGTGAESALPALARAVPEIAEPPAGTDAGEPSSPSSAPSLPESPSPAPSASAPVAAMSESAEAPLPDDGPAARLSPDTTRLDAEAPGLPALPDPEPRLETAAAPERTEPLSVNEHAAFREIAKALGARFAGDDEEPASARPESVAGFGLQGGSVTPFPSRVPDPAVEAAAVLDGIPACLLICRGESLLHANRRMLDLAGFPDLAALQQEGGLSRLFHGLPPQRHAGAVQAVAMATRDGGSRDTEIERAGMVWLGEPADCLLVRPAPTADTARATAAAAVADGFALARAADAEAALDAVDDAVVGLDGSGRVLSLNRAAAVLFGCEPREVVGGAFADLFPADSEGTVRALALGAGIGAREVSVRPGAVPQTRLLSVTAARPDGRRVAVLRDAGASRPTLPVAKTGDAEPDFAVRFGDEIRAPVTGIVGSADLILAERYGPLGDARYRDTVQGIRSSGEQVLALVDDLADLSRIESGRRELAFGPVMLNDLVADCVAHLQPQAASGRVLLRTSFDADLAPVTADAPSLRQAALAAIAAAIRETSAGGQVIVSTTQAERGEIALRVRDTGTGAQQETAPSGGGAPGLGAPGLGVPLTRALVEANHGRFRISARTGEGTLVEMMFSAPEAALRA